MIRSLCFVMVLSCSFVAATADVVLFDGTFDDGNWSTYTLLDTTTPGDASAASGQTSADGDPDPSRETNHDWQASSSGVSVRFGHLASHLVYDPGTQGPIDTLELQFDVRLPSPIRHVNTMGFGPLLVQDGLTYVAGVSYPFNPPTPWMTIDFAPATSDPTNWNKFGAPGHPDFSSSGAPITFGYFTSNGGSGTNDRLSATGRLDNYTLVITPEPGSAALFGLAGLALVRRRR